MRCHPERSPIHEHSVSYAVFTTWCLRVTGSTFHDNEMRIVDRIGNARTMAILPADVHTTMTVSDTHQLQVHGRAR